MTAYMFALFESVQAYSGRLEKTPSGGFFKKNPKTAPAADHGIIMIFLARGYNSKTQRKYIVVYLLRRDLFEQLIKIQILDIWYAHPSLLVGGAGLRSSNKLSC